MRTYTTGKVAEICKVALATVNRWVDSGRLEGHRIPGSRHRRILHDNLIKFMKDHDIPLDDLEEKPTTKVLLVTRDQVLIKNLKQKLPPEKSFKIAVAENSFEAGHQVREFRPNCIVVDFSIGKEEASGVCQSLREKKLELDWTSLIALQPDNNQEKGFVGDTVCDEVFKKPFDAKLLAERLQTLSAMQEQRAWNAPKR